MTTKGTGRTEVDPREKGGQDDCWSLDIIKIATNKEEEERYSVRCLRRKKKISERRREAR